MNQKMTLCIFHLKQGKMIYLLSIMFCIVLCVVFEISYHITITKDVFSIPVSVYDEDDTDASHALTNFLKEKLSATLTFGNKEEMENQVISYKTVMGIIIPKGFENGVVTGTREPPPEVLRYQEDKVSYMVEGAMDQYLKMGSDGIGIDLRNTKSEDEEEKMVKATRESLVVIMGILPQALMILAIFISISLVNEKQDGNLMRIYVSPVRFGQYVIGRGGGALFAMLLPGAAPVILAGLKLWCFRDYMYGTLITEAMFATVIMLFAFALGLLCTTQNTTFMMIVGLTSIGSIIGGSFFDIEGTIPIIKFSARIFPHYWAMRGIRKAILQNGISPFYAGFIVLGIFILVVMQFNYVIYKRLDRNGGK